MAAALAYPWMTYVSNGATRVAAINDTVVFDSGLLEVTESVIHLSAPSIC